MCLLTRIFILFTLMVVSVSCKDEKEDLFEDCCANPAINMEVGNGHIYVPNIFTPDNDGINDYFTINGNDFIVQINDVEIRDDDGNIVFQTSGIGPNGPLWDGRVNGIIREGMHSFSFTAIADNGVSQDIEGKVCNHPCDEDGTGPTVSDVNNCQFPTQVTDGRYDPIIASLETNECFE